MIVCTIFVLDNNNAIKEVLILFLFVNSRKTLMESYIAACPFGPNVACQACEETNDYNRILICKQCFTENNNNKKRASTMCCNAWSISNLDENPQANHPDICNSFIFCGDCIRFVNIEGYCEDCWAASKQAESSTSVIVEGETGEFGGVASNMDVDSSSS